MKCLTPFTEAWGNSRPPSEGSLGRQGTRLTRELCKRQVTFVQALGYWLGTEGTPGTSQPETWDLMPRSEEREWEGRGPELLGDNHGILICWKSFHGAICWSGGGGGGEAQSACLKVVAGTTEHPSNRHGCENVVPLSAPAWPRATGRPSESLQWETSLHCLHIIVKGGKHSQVPNGDLSEWVTPREASPVHHKRRGHFVRPVFLVILVPRK